MNRRGFLKAVGGTFAAGMLGLELALAEKADPDAIQLVGQTATVDVDGLFFQQVLNDLFLPAVSDTVIDPERIRLDRKRTPLARGVQVVFPAKHGQQRPTRNTSRAARSISRRHR